MKERVALKWCWQVKLAEDWTDHWTQQYEGRGDLGEVAGVVDAETFLDWVQRKMEKRN